MHGDGKRKSSFKNLSRAIYSPIPRNNVPAWWRVHTIRAEVGVSRRQRPRKLSSPDTNHDEVVLPVGPEHLVKPERLGLDSAQHGPGAQEGQVSLGPAAPRAQRPVPPPAPAPARVTGARGPTLDGAAPPRQPASPPRRRPARPARPDAGPRLPQPRRPGGSPPRTPAPHHWRSRLVVSGELRDAKVFWGRNLK